jgi:hypothetical protein
LPDDTYCKQASKEKLTNDHETSYKVKRKSHAETTDAA